MDQQDPCYIDSLDTKRTECDSSSKATSSCCSTKRSTQHQSVSRRSGAMAETLFLKIAGMTCAGCCTRIQNYLQEQDGIKGIQISLLTHKAEVQYDPTRLHPEAILDMIARLGFKPTAILDTRSCKVGFVVTKVERVEQAKGVLQAAIGVQTVSVADQNRLTVVYDPAVIGSRTLLEQLQNQVCPHIAVVPSSTGAEQDDETHRFLRELQTRFIASCVLTLPIVIIHFVLPLFSIDL